MSNESKQPFVFNSKWDHAAYQYLVQNCLEEMNAISENAIKSVGDPDNDDDFFTGENGYDAALAEAMGSDIRNLFIECGNEESGLLFDCNGSVDVENIFADMLAEAVENIDFTRVAAAFVAGLHLQLTIDD